MVDGERIRFDFSHGQPVTPDEIDRIEAEVNAVIRQNLPAETELMAPKEAIEAGAMALFGEKYGDSVRVLTLGHALGGEGAYSVELCGGTHVARTGDIALFKIVQEQGVAAGVRRIEALTGEAARRYLLDQAAVAKGLADQFKVPVVRGPGPRRRAGGPAPASWRRNWATPSASSPWAAARAARRRRVPRRSAASRCWPASWTASAARTCGPSPRSSRSSSPTASSPLVGTAEGKAAVTVAVTGSAQAQFNAVELAKAAVLAMGGQGAGGRPDFAQGGAPDGAKADEGLAAVKAALAG